MVTTQKVSFIRAAYNQPIIARSSLPRSALQKGCLNQLRLPDLLIQVKYFFKQLEQIFRIGRIHQKTSVLVCPGNRCLRDPGLASRGTVMWSGAALLNGGGLLFCFCPRRYLHSQAGLSLPVSYCFLGKALPLSLLQGPEPRRHQKQENKF